MGMAWVVSSEGALRQSQCCFQTNRPEVDELATVERNLYVRNGQRSALLFGPLTKGPADQQVESSSLQV